MRGCGRAVLAVARAGRVASEHPRCAGTTGVVASVAVMDVSAGSEALGIRLGTAEAVDDDGWTVRELVAAPGLDGPVGILQGGLAAGVALTIARTADPFGAPATALDARLRRPTPLGRPVLARVRALDESAHYAVETRDGDALLMSAEVELAGHDTAVAAYDLVELATVPLPPPSPQERFTSCWVCGRDSVHPYAQRLYPGLRDAATVVTPWVADDPLGDEDGAIDPLVVSGVLDCPTTWATAGAMASGLDGPVLAGYRLRFVADAPVMEALRLVARLERADGRRLHARGALVDEDGAVYALCSALHVAVPRLPDPP